MTNWNFQIAMAKATFAKQLPDYYTDMASLLESAKNIRQLDIFETDAMRYEGSARGILSKLWAERYQELGADLASTWEGFIPDDDVAVLRVQQDLGASAICSALTDLAKAAKIKRKLRSAAQTSLGVGLLALSIATTAVVFMPSWGVGVLVSSFDIPTKDWGPSGQRLAAWASAMQTFGPYVAVAVLAALGWIFWSLEHWIGTGRDWADRKILLYRVHHEMFGIRTALTMATLSKKNASTMLTLRSALQVLIASTASPWKTWQLQRVLDRVEATGAASAEVFGTGIFTQEMYWRLLDLTRAKPLAQAFAALAQAIEEMWLPKLIARMTFWRWILLVLALAVVLILVITFQGTVGEMKTVLMNSMSR